MPVAGSIMPRMLLQLCDRHEDEVRVVLAHLAFVEIDDREVVADGLRRRAGGGKRELHVVAGQHAGSGRSPSWSRKLARAMPSTTPVCCSLGRDRTSRPWRAVGSERIGVGSGDRLARWPSAISGRLRRRRLLPAAAACIGSCGRRLRACCDRGDVASRRSPCARASALRSSA